MKILKKILIFALILTIIPIFSGCTSGKSSLLIVAKPNKIVYEIGEKFDANGLTVESYNADGTTTKVCINEQEISSVDTSTAGEKVVEIKKDNLSTSFTIYVASVIIKETGQLKSVINASKDGDIIYIKQGEYKPVDESDESLYNIVVDKKLTIIGDGSKNTIVHGNFLIGAKEVNGSFLPLDNFEDFKLINVGLKLSSTIKDRYLKYEGSYENYDLYGAIKTFNSTNVYISNCSFEGFSYGINADNISNLTLLKNTFRNLKINAVKITNSIQNSSFYQNSFMDIGTSSLVMENSVQGNVGALYLSFNKKGNAGVIVSNNTFVRNGLLNGELIYATSGADELETNSSLTLTSGSYVNNSAIIFLVSTSDNNLDVGGVIISFNNFGTALNNIAFNTTNQNFVNQTGIIINDA